MSSQLGFSFEGLKNHEAFGDLAPNIVRGFWVYHRDNPHVFASLVNYGRQVIKAGRKRYSIVAIFERIRWHYQIEAAKGDDFKLNNNFRSCYARLLMLEYPEFDGMFETRVTPGSRKEV